MANVRDSARTIGKSDPIDALAVARAALREPGLPTARLDGPVREIRLLADRREALVCQRTRVINGLRWHPHELDPQWDRPHDPWTDHSAYLAIEHAWPALTSWSLGWPNDYSCRLIGEFMGVAQQSV